MRTTASRFQAETTCQGTSPKGPLSLSNDPTRGTSSSIQSDRVRAGGWGTATTKSGGSVRTRQCCLCRPRRYSEPRPADKSALDHRRKAGPSGLSPTAEAWGGPRERRGGDPTQHSALRLAYIPERRSCGGPLGQVTSSQAPVHLGGRQDNQKNKRPGSAAERGA